MAAFRTRKPGVLSFPAWCAALLLACCAWGTEPPGEAASGMDPAVVEQVRRSIAELDSADFDHRERAASRLELLANDSRHVRLLAGEISQVLAAPETSLEVRARLQQLASRLPENQRGAEPPAPTIEEIEPLLDRLSSDSSLERDSAHRRLLAMLDRVELVGPVLIAARRRLTSDLLDVHTYRTVQPILDAARGAWVQADPASVKLDEVPDEKIAEWINRLVSAVQSADAAARVRQVNARRELVDLVVRDDTRPRVLSMLVGKTGDHSDAALALREIAEYALPAMAAEVWWHSPVEWEHRQHLTAQHLLVDVPQYPEMAHKATHFDRIDDKTAHCVSGNTLTPGDYPVGLAIPHPLPAHEMMYYLVNLPTPRRRLAYEYYLRRDEAERLAHITRLTLDDLLARRKALNEREALMLCQLEPHAVSRFVGKYFDAVEDQPLVPPTTVHEQICHMLVRAGRYEAIPALEKLARSGRLGKLSTEHPFAAAWVAALATARHQPWPGVDTWLLSLLDEKAGLSFPEPTGEVGATAAGILLERHSLPASLLGLEPSGERDLEAVRLPGYRFTSEEARQEFRRWWARHEAETKAVP